MAKHKFDPKVYRALKQAGMSNREIARVLGVNEASVRRGLKSAGKSPGVRDTLMALADLLE